MLCWRCRDGRREEGRRRPVRPQSSLLLSYPSCHAIGFISQSRAIIPEQRFQQTQQRCQDKLTRLFSGDLPSKPAWFHCALTPNVHLDGERNSVARWQQQVEHETLIHSIVATARGVLRPWKILT